MYKFENIGMAVAGIMVLAAIGVLLQSGLVKISFGNKQPSKVQINDQPPQGDPVNVGKIFRPEQRGTSETERKPASSRRNDVQLDVEEKKGEIIKICKKLVYDEIISSGGSTRGAQSFSEVSHLSILKTLTNGDEAKVVAECKYEFGYLPTRQLTLFYKHYDQGWDLARWQ